MSFERDNRVSSFQIRQDGTSLSLDYYLLHTEIRGAGEYQFINVDSRIKAYLLIFVDGEELPRIVIGEGVQHIPFRIQANEYINVYVRPHEDAATIAAPHHVSHVYATLI